MQSVLCNTCGSDSFTKVLSKASPLGEVFSIVKCNSCGLVQVNPQPSEEEVFKYYSNSYFTQRTDRGYDNYYSDSMKKEISRVFQLNLQDAGFNEWEAKFQSTQKRSLDIGCAAGYFVNYMKERGYQAFGIEIAEEPSRFARESLGLTVYSEPFLEWDKKSSQSFDLITLWATIEHLHQPKETLEKIQKHLKPGGALILSTCRYGILARIKKENWRYLNVPEHLYYYSLPGILDLLQSLGYQVQKSFTYGSGMTNRKGASFVFKIAKKVFDWFVKATNQGDMMVVFATRREV